MASHLWEMLAEARGAERDHWRGVAQALACQVVHSSDAEGVVASLATMAANSDKRAAEYATRGGPVEVARRSAAEYRAAIEAIRTAQEVRERMSVGAA